jgi:predicted transcriptional regulator
MEMAKEVELSVFDLRYESYRMKNPALERRLLASITERGIEEPLEGVDTPAGKILLNGFKRYRCAKKLGLDSVPYVTLAADEVAGILTMLRTANNRALSIIEQARFIDDLRNLHKLNVAEIAETLSRSKAWVSMRLGLIGELSDTMREKIFSGAFPVYSYMYTIRPFMRMNAVKKEELEEFVAAVSGNKLSVREIEQLANGYFRGPDWFREAIKKGNLALPLERLRQVPENPDGCNEFERVLLKDLEILQKYMLRVMGKCRDQRLKTRAFAVEANLLVAGILSRLDLLTRTLKEFYDRSREA